MSASPLKRIMSPPSSQSFAWSVIAEEPALVQLIARFLPSDSDVPRGGAKQQTVLKTIASLCRAISQASRSLGPLNESFWRRLVLAHFDFKEGNTYNIGDECNVIGQDLPREFRYDEEIESNVEENEEEEDEESDWAIWRRHPLKAEMDAWKAAES